MAIKPISQPIHILDDRVHLLSNLINKVLRFCADNALCVQSQLLQVLNNSLWMHSLCYKYSRTIGSVRMCLLRRCDHDAQHHPRRLRLQHCRVCPEGIRQHRHATHRENMRSMSHKHSALLNQPLHMSVLPGFSHDSAFRSHLNFPVPVSYRIHHRQQQVSLDDRTERHHHRLPVLEMGRCHLCCGRDR